MFYTDIQLLKCRHCYLLKIIDYPILIYYNTIIIYIMFVYFIWYICAHLVLEKNKNKYIIDIFLLWFSLHRILEWLINFIRWLHDNIVDAYFLFHVINNSKDVIMYHTCYSNAFRDEQVKTILLYFSAIVIEFVQQYRYQVGMYNNNNKTIH